MQKSLEKALQTAGLAERDVTPFMRVRVVGLTSKRTSLKCCPKEGLITIWNPTEKQVRNWGLMSSDFALRYVSKTLYPFIVPICFSKLYFISSLTDLLYSTVGLQRVKLFLLLVLHR